MAGAGLAGLALGQLVHLRQQGVDANSLAELQARLARRGPGRLSAPARSWGSGTCRRARFRPEPAGLEVRRGATLR